jgi:acyl-CoA reductase-like NAD-dependent aldehyde dehydrogenase
MATPIRLALPALLTGNGVILKPAPNVAGSALALQALLYEAGFPEELFSVSCMENNLAESLLNEKLIKKLAFVGSGPVGAMLASRAASQIKPSLLELGGSDPFIVLEDADLNQASSDAAATRCSNAGQVCCSAKRMIVVKEVYNKFIEKFIAQMESKITGDPYAPETNYGPMARKDIFERLIAQVQSFKNTSAKVLLNGGPIAGKGYFFKPMVFEETTDLGFSTNEELFGPVASIYKANDAEHACKIANLSDYGLGAAVYTKNMQVAKALALELENGFVYINKPATLNPYLPFGGVKASGFGKDCGDDGYYEYVNKKVIAL